MKFSYRSTQTSLKWYYLQIKNWTLHKHLCWNILYQYSGNYEILICILKNWHTFVFVFKSFTWNIFFFSDFSPTSGNSQFTRNICVYVLLWFLPSNSWKCKRWVWTQLCLATESILDIWRKTQTQMLHVNKALSCVYTYRQCHHFYERQLWSFRRHV